MKSRVLSQKASSILMFIIVSVVAGVLVAGMGMPFVALAAGSARAASSALRNVPADLAVPPQHEGSKLKLADGSTIATFFDENRQYVPLDQISPEMQLAQIAIEDHRYYEHGAVDLKSIVRAALGNLAGGAISGGGSTLTQQYVKQVRIQMCNNDEECVREAQAPTMERKILEMRYAIALEQNLSKDEILERYLNIAYYGDGAWGVQSAAQHYFSKNASELDVAESAMLAGLVQNPAITDPVNYLDAAMQRRSVVLDAQVRYQGMSPDVAQAANETPFDASKVRRLDNGCIGARYSIVCDYARNVLVSDQMEALGPDEESRMDTLKRAGLEIVLTLDPRIQDAAQDAVSSVVGPHDAVIGVADTVDPKTGRILAMAQSRPELGEGDGRTSWNYSVENALGGAEGFGYGSTFKVYTAAAAIQQGHYPDQTHFTVPKTQDWRGHTFRGCEEGESFVLNESYRTTNAVAGQDSGTFSMKTGMMWSVNNYWIELEKLAGPCASAEMAELTGAKLALPVPDEHGFGDEWSDFAYIPAFVLGSPMVTPLSMAVSYGTFGNRGVRCDPIILESVTTRTGEEVPVPSANCQQVIDPQIADAMNYILKATHEGGLSASMHIPNGIDQASKTGTADNSQSASTFVGYTRDLSTSVIVAGDKTIPAWQAIDPQSRNVMSIPLEPLGGRGLGSLGHSGVLWKPLMEKAMEGMPPSQFEPWNPPTPPAATAPAPGQHRPQPVPQPQPAPQPPPAEPQEEPE